MRGTWATLIVNAAIPNSSSDHTGILSTGAASLGSTRPAGSTLGTSTAIAAVSTAIATNAQRHSPNWAKKPPAAGPSTVATPHIADTSAEALVHSERGRAVLITAYPKPASRPPARPCTVRPTSRTSMLGAAAHTTLPIPNTASPNRNDTRGPTRSSAVLTVVAATTDPTR